MKTYISVFGLVILLKWLDVGVFGCNCSLTEVDIPLTPTNSDTVFEIKGYCANDKCDCLALKYISKRMRNMIQYFYSRQFANISELRCFSFHFYLSNGRVSTYIRKLTDNCDALNRCRSLERDLYVLLINDSCGIEGSFCPLNFYTTQVNNTSTETSTQSACLVPNTFYNATARSCECKPSFIGNSLLGCTGTCQGVVLIKNTTFNFPLTKAGHFGYSYKKCSTGRSIATTKCTRNPNGAAEFDENSAFVVDCTTLFENITTKNITSSNIIEVLSTLNILSTNAEQLKEFADDTIGLLDRSLEVLADSDPKVVTKAIEIASTVASQVCGGFVNESASGVKEKLATSVPNMAKFLKEDAILRSSSFTIKSIEAESRAAFSPLIYTLDDTVKPAEIIVPVEAIKLNDLSRTFRLSFALDANGCLNPTNEYIETVISGSVAGLEVNNLSEPIVINFYHKSPETKSADEENSRKITVTNYKCVFWDEFSKQWSQEGCRKITNGSTITCLCNHLTNFALIFARDSLPADAVLDIVSLIGCVISIISLAITFFVYIGVKDLRKRRPTKILVNICVNLLLFYIIFITGVTQTEHDTTCTVVSILLHYFMLAAWSWMTIYSYDIYKALVTIFNQPQSHFIRICCVIAYVPPAIIVAVAASIGSLNQSNEDAVWKYRSNEMCWLSGYSFYFAFICPVGIMFSTNFILIVMVSRSLFFPRNDTLVPQNQISTKNRLYIGCTFAIATGFTWIFGFLMLISDSDYYLTLMSWMFAISNSLQGFLIFVFTCGRNKEVRKRLVSLLHCLNQNKLQSASALSMTRSTSEITSTTIANQSTNSTRL